MAHHRQSLLTGILCLIGAGLAACFLLFQGLAVLFVASAISLFGAVFQPEEVRDVRGMAAAGAMTAMTGFSVTVGLFVIGMRKLNGRKLPERRLMIAYVVMSLGLIAGTALIGREIKPPKAYIGLEGIWHEAASPKLTYRLNPDGTMNSWWEGLPHGKTGSWSRSGQVVTMRCDRDWQVVGTLGNGTITGAMSVSSTGKSLGPVTWVRKVKP